MHVGEFFKGNFSKSYEWMECYAPQTKLSREVIESEESWFHYPDNSKGLKLKENWVTNRSTSSKMRTNSLFLLASKRIKTVPRSINMFNCNAFLNGRIFHFTTQRSLRKVVNRPKRAQVACLQKGPIYGWKEQFQFEVLNPELRVRSNGGWLTDNCSDHTIIEIAVFPHAEAEGPTIEKVRNYCGTYVK